MPVHVPIRAPLPQLHYLPLQWRGRLQRLPCYVRAISGAPAILLIHGLGGAKENFTAAFQSPHLAHCTLVAPDLPGTGLAEYSPDDALDVSALAEITGLAADALLPGPYTFVGASMGGLIGALLIRRLGIGRIERVISLEGNLYPEDCMFSRRVIPHSLEHFSATVFLQMIKTMRESRYPGDHMSASNLELNVDVRAFHAYSFETVAESDSLRLLDEFISLPVPRLFVHGSANRSLSYLPRLRAAGVPIVEVANSAHFMFHDNPLRTFRAIGEFIDST